MKLGRWRGLCVVCCSRPCVGFRFIGLPHRRFIKRMKKHYGKSDKDAQEFRSEYDLP